MIKRRSQILCSGSSSGTWCTTAAWVGLLPAFRVRLVSRFTRRCRTSHLCLRNLPLVVLLAAVAYRLTGQYVIHRLRRFREEMVAVLKGTALLSLLVMATHLLPARPLRVAR